MKKYTFSFKGRQTGAIGSFYKIQRSVNSPSLGHALGWLYEHYDHISFKCVKEGNKTVHLETVRNTHVIDNTEETGRYAAH